MRLFKCMCIGKSMTGDTGNIPPPPHPVFLNPIQFLCSFELTSLRLAPPSRKSLILYQCGWLCQTKWTHIIKYRRKDIFWKYFRDMGKCFFSLSFHASSVFVVGVWMRLHRPNVLGSWTVWFGSHGFQLETLTLTLNAAFQDATHTYTSIETHSNGCFFLSKMVVIRFVPKWWLHKRNLKTSKHVFFLHLFTFLD